MKTDREIAQTIAAINDLVGQLTGTVTQMAGILAQMAEESGEGSVPR